jgi:predicted molibdopterin-dependent oxidoreductase YjgC
MSSAPATEDGGAPRPVLALRIDGAARGRPVSFRFDGQPVVAYEGESLACALACAGIRALRSSPRSRAPRGMFCLMGSCQECVVRIDGRIAPACQEPVREGMDVRSGTIGTGS